VALGMKDGHVISTVEIVEVLEEPQREVCATAEAAFDGSMLTVELDSFVRPVDLIHREQQFKPPWLPAGQVVRENVDHSEATAVTKDIFRGWVSRVRNSIPEKKGRYATEIYS
jgi:hypothetical protein